MRVIPVVSAFVVGASLVGGVAYTQFATADDMTTLSIVSEAKEPTLIDLGESGRSVGDIRLINKSFTGDDGLSGTVSGMIVTIDLPDGEDTQLDSMGQLVFEFGGMDSIVVAAESEMVPDGGDMVLEGEQVRAIIGGTGKFVGARGQMLSTEAEDGTWSYTFQLLD